MNEKINQTRRGLIIGAAALPLVGCQVFATNSKLENRALAVTQQLYSKSPSAKTTAQNAYASIVFPEIAKLGFGVGGASGNGVMYKGNTPSTHYNLSAVSLGLISGIESFSMILFLMNASAQARFNKLLGFDLGAGVEYALPKFGDNYSVTSGTFTKDMYAIIFNQAGILGGASLSAAKYTAIS